MDVPCPFCKKTLFHIREIEPGSGATGKRTDDPQIEQKNGEFSVVCPSCKKRVQMEDVPGGPSGVSLRVAKKQP